MAGRDWWQYDQAADIYRCRYAGCGYAHTEPGAVQLHYARAHLSQQHKKAPRSDVRNVTPEKSAGSAPARPRVIRAGRSCTECGGRLELLGREGPEGAARQDGYSLVCRGCQCVYA